MIQILKSYRYIYNDNAPIVFHAFVFHATDLKRKKKICQTLNATGLNIIENDFVFKLKTL